MPRYYLDVREDEAAEKARIEAELVGTPEGPKRNALVKNISQLETATHINDWLKSPGLQYQLNS